LRVLNAPDTQIGELLSAMGWDLRGLGEAQLRSLTALQRCIEDFRKTGDPEAARGILKHIGELEERSPHVQHVLRDLRETLRTVTPPG
jgi:hypothetical protein